MPVTKKFKYKDANGTEKWYDIGAKASNVDMPNGTTVEDHINDDTLHYIGVEEVTLPKESWKLKEGVYTQEYTKQVEENVVPELSASAQMDRQLNGSQIAIKAYNQGGKITFTSYEVLPTIQIDLQLRLRRTMPNPGETARVFYSNHIGSTAGIKQPLPAQVTNFSAKNNSTDAELKIDLVWTNPPTNCAGVVLIRKEGSAPNGLNDGTRVYDGTAGSYTDTTNLKVGGRYYYRTFPHNSNHEYQVDSAGAIAEVTITPGKPGQVTNLAVADVSTDTDGYRVKVTMKNPAESKYWDRTVVIRKTGSLPVEPTDGIKVYEGKSESFVDTSALTYDENYHYRAFAYNSANTFNDASSGATATISLTPGNPAGITALQAASDKGGTVTARWTNPKTSKFFANAVIVMKEGSKPTSISDGIEIYRGPAEMATYSGVQHGKTYYFRAYAANIKGGYDSEQDMTVTVTPNLIPDEPTSWSLVKTDTNSGSFTFPETGYFKIVVAGGGGKGGDGKFQGPDIGDGGYDGYNKATGGGGGGCGGFAESKFLKQKGETVSYTVGSTVTCAGMTATSGRNGGSRTGGEGGTASGGNLRNVQGEKGGYGTYQSKDAGFSVSASGGAGARNEHSYGGSGGGASGHGTNGKGDEDPGSPGSSSCVKIYRGNTNVPATTRNAEDITYLMLQNARLAQEQTTILLAQTPTETPTETEQGEKA